MQERPVQFGGLVQTPPNISSTKKRHIAACRGRYNLGKHVFAYNSQTICRTFKNSLNGAESLCNGHALFRLIVFLPNHKNWKTYFFELLVGILSDLRETWHVHSGFELDLIWSYQKNFARSKNAQIIHKHISVASCKRVNCLISRSN